jgi:formate/nitrite transporter
MEGFNPPRRIAELVSETAQAKCKLSWFQLLILGILAGAYIGFGAELSTIVTYDMSERLGTGMARFIAGSTFSVGLMLVVIAGAELFTGNCLMALGLAGGKIRLVKMVKNWFWVYFANFMGSLALVGIMFGAGLWKVGEMGVGIRALEIALSKCNLGWWEAFFRGIGCNWLVCLAIWLAMSSNSVAGKIFGIYFPIMAFVASGFEHSIANMYFIPMGILLKNTLVATRAGLDLANLSWSGFFLRNLIPVTMGNIIGGAFFVGILYRIVYFGKDENS